MCTGSFLGDHATNKTIRSMDFVATTRMNVAEEEVVETGTRTNIASPPDTSSTTIDVAALTTAKTVATIEEMIEIVSATIATGRECRCTEEMINVVTTTTAATRTGGAIDEAETTTTTIVVTTETIAGVANKVTTNLSG